MKTTKTTLKLKDIVVDEELYPRNQPYWQTAYAYSESMKLGNQFPPIVVAQLPKTKVYVLVDGRHRLQACKILKKQKVAVEVLIGLNKKKIYEEAIRRNSAHGQRFSIQERLNIALKLRDTKYTTKQISNLVQIVPTKLTSLLSNRLVNSITGEDVILKRDLEHLGRNGNDEVDVATIQRDFRGNSQLHLVKELIVLIKTKTLNVKDKKVLNAITTLKKLLKSIKTK